MTSSIAERVVQSFMDHYKENTTDGQVFIDHNRIRNSNDRSFQDSTDGREFLNHNRIRNINDSSFQNNTDDRAFLNHSRIENSNDRSFQDSTDGREFLNHNKIRNSNDRSFQNSSDGRAFLDHNRIRNSNDRSFQDPNNDVNSESISLIPDYLKERKCQSSLNCYKDKSNSDIKTINYHEIKNVNCQSYSVYHTEVNNNGKLFTDYPKKITIDDHSFLKCHQDVSRNGKSFQNHYAKVNKYGIKHPESHQDVSSNGKLFQNHYDKANRYGIKHLDYYKHFGRLSPNYQRIENRDGQSILVDHKQPNTDDQSIRMHHKEVNSNKQSILNYHTVENSDGLWLIPDSSALLTEKPGNETEDVYGVTKTLNNKKFQSECPTRQNCALPTFNVSYGQLPSQNNNSSPYASVADKNCDYAYHPDYQNKRYFNELKNPKTTYTILPVDALTENLFRISEEINPLTTSKTYSHSSVEQRDYPRHEYSTNTEYSKESISTPCAKVKYIAMSNEHKYSTNTEYSKKSISTPCAKVKYIAMSNEMHKGLKSSLISKNYDNIKNSLISKDYDNIKEYNKHNNSEVKFLLPVTQSQEYFSLNNGDGKSDNGTEAVPQSQEHFTLNNGDGKSDNGTEAVPQSQEYFTLNNGEGKSANGMEAVKENIIIYATNTLGLQNNIAFHSPVHLIHENNKIGQKNNSLSQIVESTPVDGFVQINQYDYSIHSDSGINNQESVHSRHESDTDYDDNDEKLDLLQKIEDESDLVNFIINNDVCQAHHKEETVDSKSVLMDYNDMKEIFMKIDSDIKKRNRGPKIWEFLVRLLINESTNPSLICWEHKEFHIFRLTSPHKIALLWNSRGSSSKKLPYSNFARALRYWYRRGGLEMVEDRQLLYRLGIDAREYMSKLLGNQNKQEECSMTNTNLITNMECHTVVTKKKNRLDVQDVIVKYNDRKKMQTSTKYRQVTKTPSLYTKAGHKRRKTISHIGKVSDSKTPSKMKKSIKTNQPDPKFQRIIRSSSRSLHHLET